MSSVQSLGAVDRIKHKDVCVCARVHVCEREEGREGWREREREREHT